MVKGGYSSVSTTVTDVDVETTLLEHNKSPVECGKFINNNHFVYTKIRRADPCGSLAMRVVDTNYIYNSVMIASR